MKILVFLVVILFSSTGLYAQEKIVTLATLTDFVPFCFRKENSIQVHKEIIAPGSDSVQLQGYSWDVVRESYHAVGYTIELYVLPWARCMHYLNSDKVDAIFPANRTEKRDDFYRYSKEYVDRIRMVAYVPRDTEITWRGLSSLHGLTVGVVREWAYGKKWESNRHIKKESMDTILQSFQVLEKKRLDAVVGYEVVYDYVLKSEGIKEKYKKIGDFDIVDEYLMGKKDNPVALEKINEFDRGRRLVEQRGGLDTITRKWH
jgi:polar amino acid transport system substrate-binding protein